MLTQLKSMRHALFLALSACATQLPHVPVSMPVIAETPPSFAEAIHDQHYVGWFHNDRTQKSYPAVLQLEATQNYDKSNTDGLSKGHTDASWQLHAVLRIFVPDNKVMSSFYPDVQLMQARSNDALLFPKITAQKITIVGKGKLQHDGSAKLFAVIYGFGQGIIQLQRQAISSYALPTTSKYPLALTKINMNYTEFPRQAFIQQQQHLSSDTKLLEDAKNILSAGLYSIDYQLRTRLGVYYGVLHHEYHNHFQYVRLALAGGEQQDTLTTASTLFFSLPQGREFIVYRYANKITGENLPTILSGQGDNFLKINKWDRNVVEALWYSKTHGRIGHVYLQRNSFPQLPKNAQVVSALAGNYSNTNFSCDIKVDNKVANDLSLYPSAVHGVVRDLELRKNHLISSGRYDFYRDNVEIIYSGNLMRYGLQQEEFIPTVVNTGLVR